MTYRFRCLPVATILSLLLLAPISNAASPHPAWGRDGMVVSAHPLASEAGLRILKEGGNAVDAAAAVAFALGVVEPYHSGIGGGGFMLIHLAESQETVVIDYRETAPEKATLESYIDDEGILIPLMSTVGSRAVAVPGTVAGLALALERFGTKSLAEVVEPSIAYARDGFVIDPVFSAFIAHNISKLRQFPATSATFLKDDSLGFQPGEIMVQEDLATTYQEIAVYGTDAFYRGSIAETIIGYMRENHGLLRKADLEGYRPIIRQPVRGTYRGYHVLSVPPPSSGGVHIIQMLNILEGFPLGWLGHNSSSTIHLLAETMKLAFADRAAFLGDPGFCQIPLRGLISPDYAHHLRARIHRHRADLVSGAGDPAGFQGGGTTHLSVIDGSGNCVSLTQTINLAFGSGVIVPGTGFLLNNEMDDFSLQPGVPNVFGLVGGDANAVAPGKRPLSSMSPTLVFKDGKPFLIAGSTGGPRIITTVLQIIIDVIDHGMDIQEAVDAPRAHHQWLPDVLYLEQGIPLDVVENLTLKGHRIEQYGEWSGAQCILVDENTGMFFGASDPRRGGKAMGY